VAAESIEASATIVNEEDARALTAGEVEARQARAEAEAQTLAMDEVGQEGRGWCREDGAAHEQKKKRSEIRC
jgi:hypothetical protein